MDAVKNLSLMFIQKMSLEIMFQFYCRKSYNLDFPTRIYWQLADVLEMTDSFTLPPLV